MIVNYAIQTVRAIREVITEMVRLEEYPELLIDGNIEVVEIVHDFLEHRIQGINYRQS